jgi:AcrR family transcriptional regulator
MSTPSAPLRLGRDELGDARHVCALFEGTEDANSVLVPFMREGLDRGDQVVHLVEDREVYRNGLNGQIPIAEAVDSGQLRIEGWDQAYLRDGSFSASKMLAYLRVSLRESVSLGYSGTRLIGDMDWAQDDVPGVDKLVAYESDVDALLWRANDVIVCAYDLRSHSASRIAAVLAVHHTIFVDGRLQRTGSAARRASARDRILAAAANLFTEQGVRATGVDALIAAADVAKATFYRHFPSKDDLIVAWLQDPDTSLFPQITTRAETLATSRAETALEFFTAVAEWLETDGFRGSPIVNTSVEIRDPSHPASVIIRQRLERSERYLQDTLAKAGYRDAARLGTALHTLIIGAIILGVANRTTSFVLTAREVAAQLLESAGRHDAQEQEG